MHKVVYGWVKIMKKKSSDNNFYGTNMRRKNRIDKFRFFLESTWQVPGRKNIKKHNLCHNARLLATNFLPLFNYFHTWEIANYTALLIHLSLKELLNGRCYKSFWMSAIVNDLYKIEKFYIFSNVKTLRYRFFSSFLIFVSRLSRIFKREHKISPRISIQVLKNLLSFHRIQSLGQMFFDEPNHWFLKKIFFPFGKSE